MTVNLVVNGVTYEYPETGDTNWGPEATDWASAVTVGMLQKAGGAFTLLADVNFGASFGLVSSYYKSRSANISATGVLRMANTDFIGFRNFANSGDLELGVNTSNLLTFNGIPVQNQIGVTDTPSIDLTFTAGIDNLSANLNLSAELPDSGYQAVALNTELDGLRAQISNANIFSALPNASTSTTGLLTNTDWNTFNGKQASGNYITALTGDVTATGPGSVAATIANSAVTLAKMANLAANSIIGNNTGSPATPIALTVAQTTAMLDSFVGDSGSGGTKGLVPAPAAGDAAAVKFLKADGTWATTPAGPTQATATTLGIVQGGTVPGTTAGAVGAGYLGELVQTVVTTDQAGSTTSGTWTTGATLSSLSIGIWDITVTFPYIELTGSSGDAGNAQGRTISARLYDVTAGSDIRQFTCPGLSKAAVSGGYMLSSCCFVVSGVSVTTPTVFRSEFTSVNNSGTITITGLSAAGSSARPIVISAIRVG